MTLVHAATGYCMVIRLKPFEGVGLAADVCCDYVCWLQLICIWDASCHLGPYKELAARCGMHLVVVSL